VSISKQKIQKNIKTYETIEKDKISCFLSLIAQQSGELFYETKSRRRTVALLLIPVPGTMKKINRPKRGENHGSTS
jgi:hypothetical protein